MIRGACLAEAGATCKPFALCSKLWLVPLVIHLILKCLAIQPETKLETKRAGQNQKPNIHLALLPPVAHHSCESPPK